MHSQACEIVSNVHEFMRREAEADEILIDLKKVQESVAQCTGCLLYTSRCV